MENENHLDSRIDVGNSLNTSCFDLFFWIFVRFRKVFGLLSVFLIEIVSEPIIHSDFETDNLC
jgi:hypothetical protein